MLCKLQETYVKSNIPLLTVMSKRQPKYIQKIVHILFVNIFKKSTSELRCVVEVILVSYRISITHIMYCICFVHFFLIAWVYTQAILKNLYIIYINIYIIALCTCITIYLKFFNFY